MATEAKERLIVFGKSPRAGAVKTRLIPLLGAQGAADLHTLLLDRALETARAYRSAELELHADHIDDSAIQACAARHRAALLAQSGADLGERMCAAFVRALSTDGCTGVVMIGADCPSLTRAHISNAFAALRDGCDAVFAPAEDGGYVLIGLSRVDAALFSGIAWSTDAVMAHTRRRLRDVGWSWRELDTLWDVDRPEDYVRLARSGLTPVGDT